MREVPGYGEGPLHLIGHLAVWALAAVAAVRLLETSPWLTAAALAAGIIVHDAMFFPLYAVADQRLRVWQRGDGAAGPSVPWINHVRVPAVISGTLLLLWFPIVLRLADERPEFTGLSQDPFLYRWLAVSAAASLASAALYAVRLRRS